MSKDELERAIEIIISSSEIGAHQQGTAEGPIALLNMLFDGSKSPFPVLNTVVSNEVSEHFSNAKNIHSLSDNFSNAYTTIRDSLSHNKFPLILSGDHSNAISSIAAFSDEFGRNNLGVIWVDAHADLHTPATTPSGNVHGMPLGAMLNLDVLYAYSGFKIEKFMGRGKRPGRYREIAEIET
jgi:arginase